MSRETADGDARTSIKALRSLLNDTGSMANSSSEHADLNTTSPQPHRAEILENPLQVSLFHFFFLKGKKVFGSGAADTVSVTWNSRCYTWLFQIYG